METNKNVVHEEVNTNGGDFINGDNNFIVKLISDSNYQVEKYHSIVQQTKRVLGKFQDNIGGHKLKRQLSSTFIGDLIENKQIIFIKGVAGSGKSVYAKQLLELLNNTCIISFAADQFLESSLISVLSKMSIDLDLERLFDSFSEFPQKLIYVDSFEKLQEGEADAFKELISLLRDNHDIKIILSCREYALETLKFRFFDKSDSYEIIDVPTLDDIEVKFFIDKVPALTSIISNPRLTEVLRVPKYLSLAERLIAKSSADYSETDEVLFKKELWTYIIEGTITQNAINKRRGKAFIDTTVKRAKELSILTNVESFDLEAIELLRGEGVLFEESNFYAPSHDILEDWGLIRHINKLRIENPILFDFYNCLGNQPAIRRAFRLWIESEIEENGDICYNFIIESLYSNVDNHWKDEILTAITKSRFCKKYFNENKTQLSENKFDLLKRFIHLLRISGKDSEQVPNNNGWNVVIEFVHSNIHVLQDAYSLILLLLLDWERILYSSKGNHKDTHFYAGKVAFKIIEDSIDKEDWDSWGNRGEDSIFNRTIRLLFQLTEYIQPDIKGMLDNLLLDIKTKDRNYKRENFQRICVKYALSHFYSGTLPKFFPNELIELGKKNWYENKVNERDPWEHSSLETEHYFGIKHSYPGYSPESSYQTFVYKLLHNHPWIGLNFLIEFTNYTAQKYVKSSFLKDPEGFYKDTCIDVAFLYKETNYKVHGSEYLWSVNRGGQIVVPDLLQSIVVSLERFLHDLGGYTQSDSEFAKVYEELVQKFFNEIYCNSNSVILISVLASIAMAFPKIVGDKLLPLVSNRHFFDWDRHRWFQDVYHGDSLLNFLEPSIIAQLCNEERKEALKWEHRAKYDKGLAGFIIDYQFRIGTFNDDIFKMLDYVATTIAEDDVYGKKLITEIDRRTWVVSNTIKSEDNVMIEIRPDYSVDERLEDVMKKNEEAKKIQDEYSRFSVWVTKSYQNKTEEKRTYANWKECFEYLKDLDETIIPDFNVFPMGAFGVIGLEYFMDELQDDEVSLCVDVILSIANDLYEKKKDKFNNLNLFSKISIYDDEAVSKFLPKMLAFQGKITQEQSTFLKEILFAFIRDIHASSDHRIKDMLGSFRENVWVSDYQYAYNCFVGILLYAELFKKYPQRRLYDEAQMKIIETEEIKILDFIRENKTEFDFKELSYAKFSHWYISKMVQIFPINRTFNFSHYFLSKILSAQIESYDLKNKTNDGTRYYDIGILIKNCIVEFLLANEFDDRSKEIFQQILNTAGGKKRFYDTAYQNEIIEAFYYKVDDKIEDLRIRQNFWLLWDELYKWIIKNDTIQFDKEFLFYSSYWKQDADNWLALKDNGSLYVSKLNLLAHINTDALLQLLSGIGFQALMPDGIRILAKHLKDSIKELSGNNFFYGEKLIMHVFQQKFKTIKKDAVLLNDFLWFLNLMIASGSSKAYLIRENIILYKPQLN